MKDGDIFLKKIIIKTLTQDDVLTAWSGGRGRTSVKRASAMTGTGGAGANRPPCGIDIKRFRKHNFFQPGGCR